MDPDRKIISFLKLRQAIGRLGTALPFVLFFGALFIFRTGLQSSLSAYYHTQMGSVFVGTLCAIGVFLYAYRGYDEGRFSDNAVGNVAGICAIGTALFPTDPSTADDIPKTAVAWAHALFAGVFFLSLAYFCLCLFVRTTNPPPSPLPEPKRKRNRVYRVSGVTILIAITLIVVQAVLPDGIRQAFVPDNLVFLLESIAVVAFGCAWLTKGQSFFADPKVDQQ